MPRNKYISVLALVALYCQALVAAPSAPTLPASERLVYSRKTGDKIDEVEMRTRLVSDKDGSYFELTIGSPDQDGLYRLDINSLVAKYSDVTTRTKDTTIRRITTIVENRVMLNPGEILLSGTDASSMGQTLRIFPWGSKNKAKLVFLGTGGTSASAFSFELNVVGKETILAGGKQIECWKAQVGLSGIFGGLVGKTSLWFSVAAPHYLVKSDGASGPPGSPNSTMELISYTASASAD